METYPSEESLYAVPFKNTVAGILNPVFGQCDDPTGYEISSSEYFPAEGATSEMDDAHANPTHQYINQVSLDRDNALSTHRDSNSGKQLEQNDDISYIGMGYNSCNDIALGRVCSNNIVTPVQHNTKQGVEFEREGYVQPKEIFNSASVNQSNTSNENYPYNPLGNDDEGIRNLHVERDTGSADLPHEENGYMSPTNSPGINDAADTVSKTVVVGACENPYTGTPTATRRDYQRNDSGVVDCDPVKDLTPGPVPFRSRLSTSIEEHYEDIDVYRNVQGGGAPSKKNSTKRPVAKERAAKIKIVPRSASLPCQRPGVDHDRTHSNMQTINEAPKATPNSKRSHKSNSASSESPNPYTHIDMITPLVESDKKSQGMGRQSCILSSILLALFLLVTVSLAVSVSLLLMRDKDVVVERVNYQTNNANASGQIYQQLPMEDRGLMFELQSQIHSLKAKTEALEEILEKQRNETNAKLNAVMTSQTNLTSNMDSLSTTLHSHVANFTSILQTKSLDSLSSCQMETDTNTRLNPNGISMETTFKPGQEALKDNFVLFAFCTFMGMEDVNLDVQSTGSLIQYRCRCKATKKKLSYKSCTLHYWLCPRG